MTVPKGLNRELPHESEMTLSACRVKIALHGEKLAVSSWLHIDKKSYSALSWKDISDYEKDKEKSTPQRR